MVMLISFVKQLRIREFTKLRLKYEISRAIVIRKWSR